MTQYNDSVNRILEARRNKSADLQRKHTEEVYKALPFIREIDEHIQTLMMQVVSFALEGRDTSGLETQIQKLRSDKCNLLHREGYSDDYLERIPTCSLCGDSGVYENKMCSCKRQLLVSQAYAMSSIEDQIQRENFERFDMRLFRRNPNADEDLSPWENMDYVLSAAKGYVADFRKTGNENILYYGPVGTGKTFLANAISKGIIDRGFTVLYQSAPDLFDLMSTYQFLPSSEKISQKETIDRLYQVDLLVIDDLGSETVTVVSQALLSELINARLLSRKATLISTNLEPYDLEKTYGARAASRIIGNYRLFHIYGDDLRIKKLEL